MLNRVKSVIIAIIMRFGLNGSLVKTLTNVYLTMYLCASHNVFAIIQIRMLRWMYIVTRRDNIRNEHIVGHQDRENNKRETKHKVEICV